ncbi:MAG: bifunctional 5,10-methylenetetrahydrofolate dehydrogenase/5,10-methenyltetrahydrofolate cyclohydrolase [Gammaproteobacteria bacterium]|nr:bifunctional 5,10-methylenetetrahydrofolate dehydrogenase/5,10-methenyltetrahydrofolate cyclohydrolase [Gammaproteobacteria bacterium]
MIIDGKKVALELREKIKARLARHPHLKITLATVSVGDDPASKVYVGMQHRTAEAAGLYPEHIQLAAGTSQKQLEEQIEQLAQDDKVHGIILQLPLPDPLDKDAALAKIPPNKDIDGQTDVNMGRLLQGRKQLVPCTPLGVMRLIEAYNIETSGRTAVVVGRSAVVGLPQFLLLSEKGVDATVTVAHSRTRDLAELCKSADILVSAIGSPALITEAYVKPGAMVFDVGVTETPSGIQGDVDFDAVSKIAGGVTPMPGGTGPMTVACLLENTLLAAQLQNALPS